MILNTPVLSRFGRAPGDASAELSPEDARLYVPSVLVPTTELKYPLSHEALLGFGDSFIFNQRQFSQAGVGNAEAILTGYIPGGSYELSGECCVGETNAGTNSFINTLSLTLTGMSVSAPLFFFPPLAFVGGFGGENPLFFSRRLIFEKPWFLTFIYGGNDAANTVNVYLTMQLQRFL